MRRAITLAIVAAALAVVGATGGPLGSGPLIVQASSTCKGCTDFDQAVTGHNSGRASNSICFDQIIGSLDTKENEGTISASAGACDGFGLNLCSNIGPCLIDQELGDVRGSKGNTAKITNSAGSIVGLDQFAGSFAGNDLFSGISGSASNNQLNISNGGDDTGGCGPTAGELCGQVVDGGNSNRLSWSNGHGNTQQVFFFDVAGGKGANHNVMNLKGSHVAQWITNSTDPEFLTAALTGSPEPTSGTPTTGVLGLKASSNKLSYSGSNGTQLVQDGSNNDLTNNGNFAFETVVNGSGNQVSTTGSSNTVTITGSSPTSTADDNSVTIIGNYDTVTLTGLSDQRVVIVGNGITCSSSCNIH